MRRRDGGPRRRLVTVLFTDIVGSTRLATELGDRTWRQLLARHHAIVRRELKRFGGRRSIPPAMGSLARIGIRLTVRDVADPAAEAAKPGSHIDLYNAFLVQEVADAASFLHRELTEAMPAGWLPKGVGKELERVDALGSQERTAAAQHLAQRLAANDVPVVVFGAGFAPSYLSPSLGCRVFPRTGTASTWRPSARRRTPRSLELPLTDRRYHSGPADLRGGGTT